MKMQQKVRKTLFKQFQVFEKLFLKKKVFEKQEKKCS